MDSTQRTKVIKDIVNHKIELVEVGSGDAVSDEELDELEEELSGLPDSELENWWFSTVGEWIEPMTRWSNHDFYNNGTPVWESQNYDSVAEWQFNKLKETGETDYGYNQVMYTQPY